MIEQLDNETYQEASEIRKKYLNEDKEQKVINLEEFKKKNIKTQQLQSFIKEKEQTMSHIHSKLLQNSILQKKQENNTFHDQEYVKVSFIFKTKDDVRHDTLTLKFIQLLKEIFEKEKVKLFLRPYNTFSNRVGEDQSLGGIIEVLKNASSIADIGKKSDMHLYEYFRNRFD